MSSVYTTPPSSPTRLNRNGFPIKYGTPERKVSPDKKIPRKMYEPVPNISTLPGFIPAPKVKGLVLVWDLDNTLIGWNADGTKYTMNVNALYVLNKAFIAQEKGIVSANILLSNNSQPDKPVADIESRLGRKFTFVVGRRPKDYWYRDIMNQDIKDLATIRKIIGNVDANQVYIIDDIRHKMVDEGAHWIQVVTQEGNPFKTGYYEGTDTTDYSELLRAIDNKSVGGKYKKSRRSSKRKFRKTRKVRKVKKN